MESTTPRAALLKFCQEFAARSIAIAQQALDDAQAAANQEEKSSVGDKYETGRSMMQLETGRVARQVGEAMKLKEALNRIGHFAGGSVVGAGSIVITRNITVFLAIGIGKAVVDGKEYLIVAPESPLGKSVIGKKVHEGFMFAGQLNIIENIL